MKNHMTIGGKYNWRGQPEQLIYKGKNWSGNGYWHQFAKIDRPNIIWCEVLDKDLDSSEETVSNTQLVNGRIPAHTAWPYAQRCEINQGGSCHHQGTEHDTEFSCAVARAYELTDSF